jgi:glycosyltransferase involved in cell wall biosynthesis
VSLLEGMAMGKPIVATDMGEQSEIIEDGINGHLVPPGDVRQMASSILQVITDPGGLERMSRQARERAKAYGVDAYADRLQQLYSSLAAEAASRRSDGR